MYIYIYHLTVVFLPLYMRNLGRCQILIRYQVLLNFLVLRLECYTFPGISLKTRNFSWNIWMQYCKFFIRLHRSIDYFSPYCYQLLYEPSGILFQLWLLPQILMLLYERSFFSEWRTLLKVDSLVSCKEKL